MKNNEPHQTTAADVVTEEFSEYEAACGEAGRLAVFRAGWDAACGHRPWKRLPIRVDPSMPAGELHMRDDAGNTVGKIVNIGEADVG